MLFECICCIVTNEPTICNNSLLGEKKKAKPLFVKRVIVSLWAVICMPDNLRAGCHTPYPSTTCCAPMLPVCWHVPPVPQPQIWKDWNPGRNLTHAVYWLRLHPRCSPHPHHCGTSLGYVMWLLHQPWWFVLGVVPWILWSPQMLVLSERKNKEVLIQISR